MELYDLTRDPGEKNNVIAEHPEHVARLKRKATHIVLSGRTTPGAPQANDTGYWNSLEWVTEAEYESNAVPNKQVKEYQEVPLDQQRFPHEELPPTSFHLTQQESHQR
jgi:uncharacterized protein YciI